MPAVIRMLEDGRECADVLPQLSAVSKALSKAGFAIVASSLQECLTNPDNDSGTDIADYVATGSGMDKAGGLALQAEAGSFIDRVDGCWANVLGLPLCAVSGLLDRRPADRRAENRCRRLLAQAVRSAGHHEAHGAGAGERRRNPKGNRQQSAGRRPR